MIFALLGIIEGKSPYEEMKNEKLSGQHIWGYLNHLGKEREPRLLED